MTSRCSRLTGLAAVLLFAASTPLLAQDDDEHSVHHPEAQAAERGTQPAPETGAACRHDGAGHDAPRNDGARRGRARVDAGGHDAEA